MSKLGKRWEIDGIPAAFITRSAVNGHYCITFEREEASLEQLEQIQWEAPAIKRLTDHESEPSLPEGYGFEITDIRYQHSGRYFTVEVCTAKQYLGDVTPYEEQIDTLTKTVTQQQAVLDAQTAQYTSVISSMENAYKEGVESNG